MRKSAMRVFLEPKPPVLTALPRCGAASASVNPLGSSPRLDLYRFVCVFHLDRSKWQLSNTISAVLPDSFNFRPVGA